LTKSEGKYAKFKPEYKPFFGNCMYNFREEVSDLAEGYFDSFSVMVLRKAI
jgi:hypothetical protein